MQEFSTQLMSQAPTHQRFSNTDEVIKTEDDKDDDEGITMTPAITYARQVYRATDVVITEEDHYDDHLVITEYNAIRLAGLRVLCTKIPCTAAVRVIFAEQAIIVVIYILTAVACFYGQEAYSFLHGDEELKLMEQIVTALNTLAVFFLALYTSLSLERWWRLRTQGVGNICSASDQLCLFVSQHVTRDERVLSAFRRYSRASLMLIFMQHREQSQDLDLLRRRQVLNAEEVQCLKGYNENLSESIWTWHTAIVMMLFKQGLIKSEYSLWKLLDITRLGCEGAGTICGQLATPLPYHYVVILGFLVKLHNIMHAFTIGARAADDSQKGYIFFYLVAGCVKVFFPAFIYNSVLVLNALLTNPFAKHVLAFSQSNFDRSMESSGKSFVDAGAHCPRWILNAEVGAGGALFTINEDDKS